MVEQHPRVVQQLEPFERRVTVLSDPPIRTVVLKVAVAKIVDFRDEILGPNPSRGMNPPRVVTLRSVDNLCVPRIVPCGPLGDSNEGFDVGLSATAHIHPVRVLPVLDCAEKPVIVDQPHGVASALAAEITQSTVGQVLW